MTPTQLAEIRSRLEKATPGPWKLRTDYDCDGNPIEYVVNDEVHSYICESPLDNDAPFIVNAPTDIRMLLDHVAALEKKLEKAKEALQFNKANWEAVHSEGYKHLTAWQKCRDALAEVEKLALGGG